MSDLSDQIDAIFGRDPDNVLLADMSELMTLSPETGNLAVKEPWNNYQAYADMRVAIMHVYDLTPREFNTRYQRVSKVLWNLLLGSAVLNPEDFLDK